MVRGQGDTNIVVALPAHCVEMCIVLTCSNEQVTMPVVDERKEYGPWVSKLHSND